MATIAKKLKILPNSPGIYIFYGEDREVLYVGKATSLKDRVRSYFRSLNLTPSPAPYQGEGDVGGRPIELFINEVVDVKVRKTDTVLEAFIKEQELIKHLQPKYNAIGKDDRSFCYAVITKEKFPRVLVMRETELEKISISNDQILKNRVSQNTKYKIPYTKIYGPYTSRQQIETALKIMRRIFPYHVRPQATEKGCFDFHLGLCPGPYDGAISRKDYLKNIWGIRLILDGKKKSLIRKMEKEMQLCSESQDYEGAARVRNQLFALKHIQDIAMITNEKPHPNPLLGKGRELTRIEGYDISNISGQYSVGSLVVFDNTTGEIQANKSEYRKFRIKTVEGINDVGAMEEVLRRRFQNSWKLPDLLVIDGGRGHLNMARRVLKTFRHDISILAVAKGPTRKKLDIYSWGNIPKLPKDILEQIRNEAHRFAITYHRKLRGKLLNG